MTPKERLEEMANTCAELAAAFRWLGGLDRANADALRAEEIESRAAALESDADLLRTIAAEV